MSSDREKAMRLKRHPFPFGIRFLSLLLESVNNLKKKHVKIHKVDEVAPYQTEVAMHACFY